MEKITAIYCRTAHQDPDGPSVCTQQESKARRYARENGHGNIRVFTDSEWSGMNLDRPAFKELQRAIENGRVATVIVTGIDRIGRNMADVIGWVQDTRALGVHVSAIDHELYFTDAIFGASLGKRK